MDKAIAGNRLPEVDVEELDLDEIELANLDDELARSTPSLYQRAVHAIGEFASFSTLLRIGGALALIASMSVFLLQDWVAGDDITRFYLLLTQTALLAAGGLSLGFLLKEHKGARVFFGLGLLSISANITTLGALIYSVVQWNGVIASFPSFATWQSASWSDVAGALAIGPAVSAPIALFAYLVLARRFAKSLTLFFLMVNGLMLLPVRESWMSGATILLSLAVPLFFLYTQVRGKHAALTRENIFAVITLFVPALIITVRNLLWYEVDAVLQIILGVTAFIGLRIAVSTSSSNTSVARVCRGLAIPVAGYIAVVFADLVAVAGMTDLFLPVAGAVFALLVFDVAERAGDDQSICAKIAGGVLLAANIVQVVLLGGFVSAVLCVIAGLGLIISGKRYKSRSLLSMGIIAMVVSIGQQIYRAIEMVDFGSWISLAIIGALAIVIGSLAERYGAVAKLKWEQWSARQ